MALPPSPRHPLLADRSKTFHAILGGARRPQGAAEAGGQEAQARGRVRHAPGGRAEAHSGKTGECATTKDDIISLNANKGLSRNDVC